MDYCKVLIIDDEFITRQGLKYMIDWEKEGFQIIGEASNGQEGLELVEKLSPHIVLVDIVMPVIDGLEFSKIMSKNFPFVKIIIISSHEKFEYVRTSLINGATDYILKPTLKPTSLLEVLIRTAEKITDINLEKQGMPYTTQLEKFLVGYSDTIDVIEFKNTFTKKLYRLISVDTRTILNINKEDVKYIKNTIEEHFNTNDKFNHITILLDERIICVLLNYNDCDDRDIINSCSELIEKVKRIYKGIFFVMSRYFININEVKKYYESDIKSELSNGFYYFDNSFLIINKKNDIKSFERFPFDDFTNNLSKGSYRIALNMFKEYIFYLIDNKKEPYKLKNLTKNLLYNYLMEIEKFSIDSEDIRSIYFQKIDNCENSIDYNEICKEMFNLLDLKLKLKVEVDDFRIIKIKEYVSAHYNEQLELSDLASKFNFSYSYLSSYFSQMSKEGFSEYLNKIRIEKACDKLIKTDMSIANICSSVGYSDHSYFCRVFKKLTKETPSNFRKRRGRGIE